MRIIAGILSFVLMFSFALPSFVDATVELNDDTIVEEYVPNFDFEKFENEYDFLVTDPVFLQLEGELSKPRVEYVIEKNPLTGELIVKQEILPALVIGALRVLTSKAGRTAADKGWKIARPYVQKALDAQNKYILEGPYKTRIIQVRSKVTKKVLFRLDYGPVKNKGPYLHYHVPPNLNDHHIIW
ncbi:hypothetical protein ACWFRC_12550 [Bacillus cereus]